MKLDLIEIFQSIRALMQPYKALGFVNRDNTDTHYTLWSEKNVTIDGQPCTESYFAGVKIMDDHVCLHLIPSHVNLDNEMIIHKHLLSLHSDTTCFIIRTLDNTLLDEITEALSSGYNFYLKKEWV